MCTRETERARCIHKQGEADSATKSRWMLAAEFQATLSVSHFRHGEAGFKEMAKELSRHGEATRYGDLTRPESMLMAQLFWWRAGSWRRDEHSKRRHWWRAGQYKRQSNQRASNYAPLPEGAVP